MSPTGDTAPRDSGDLRSCITAATGMPPAYAPYYEMGTSARLLKEPLERMGKAAAKMAEKLQALAPIMLQAFAEITEAKHRQEALDRYNLAKLEALLDPTIRVELITGERGGCRVVVRRVGGWT